ncbi:putative hydrolase [Gordonia soli NBRC 108243]|uniref:Putative hydrolase n=1 Tax=Gordonia soli NBRC 108243 TaxID=1223545 RepID=M0QP02_9ACTN|nr:putative hydrolase [Gordonia soli NBRC 108243]
MYFRHFDTRDEPIAGVIFLHGFGEHSGLYHRYAAELAAHGVAVWALDQIGHGLSDGERGDFGSFATVVDNAARLTAQAHAQFPDLPLVIAGHSVGSVGAVLAGIDAPDRYRAVVISGAPLSPLPWLPTGERQGEAGEAFELDPATLSADPFYLDQLENDPLAFTGADVERLLATAFPPAWERLDADLAGIRLPILAVHGRDDQVAPLDGVIAWQDRVSGLRIEVVDDAGHDVLNEVAHARVADLIGEFIAGTVGARPESSEVSA